LNTTAPSGTEKLTPEQLRALYALLEHGDKAKAARSAGVGRTTLYRWLREDANFQAALEASTQQALKEFSLNLVRLAHKAATALEAALDSTEPIHMHHRLRAADIVTNRLLAVREAVDIEERLAALEANYAQTR
jgi:hypothetical protein